jgi:hypothetical protein
VERKIQRTDKQVKVGDKMPEAMEVLQVYKSHLEEFNPHALPVERNDRK